MQPFHNPSSEVRTETSFISIPSHQKSHSSSSSKRKSKRSKRAQRRFNQEANRFNQEANRKVPNRFVDAFAIIGGLALGIGSIACIAYFGLYLPKIKEAFNFQISFIEKETPLSVEEVESMREAALKFIDHSFNNLLFNFKTFHGEDKVMEECFPDLVFNNESLHIFSPLLKQVVSYYNRFCPKQ